MLYKDNAGEKHLQSLRDKTFKLGLPIGCSLDDKLRFKKGNLVVMAGHANVGKTLSIMYYFVCLAIKHNLKFVIFSSENEIGSVKDDILTLYNQQKVENLDDTDFMHSNMWLNEHFKFFNADGFFVQNKRLMNFRDILKECNELDFDFDGLVIDPYNSLGRCDDIGGSRHEYDYTVMAEMRIWCKTTKKTAYILAHGNTEALRKTHPKGHDYEGHSIPLVPADIEGGGKFVNRCDDFVVIHRYTQHKHEFMKTEWHVVKVKNTKTGGRPTFKENPIILEAKKDLLGFRVYTKEDPFAEPKEWSDPIEQKEYKVEFKEPKPLKPLVNNDFDIDFENKNDEIPF